MRLRFWTQVVVVVVLMTGGIVKVQALFPRGPSCPASDKGKEYIVCNLTNKEDQDHVMETTTIETAFTKWEVIGASNLEIEEQCNLATSELILVDSQNILTKSSEETCEVVPLLVRLQNSNAKDISHVAGTIRLELDSTAESISLDNVDQFDFENSTIQDISILATKFLSTIIDSSIVNVNEMEIKGNFRFQAERSNLMYVRGFIYNSTYPQTSNMNEVLIERVYTMGIIITAGNFLMEEVTFRTLDSKSLVMNGVTELTIRNSVMENVRLDSMYIEKGKIIFVNVTVGSHTGISFTFSADSQAGIMPLALILNCTTSPLWILGIIISTVVGLIVGSITIYFVMRKTKLFQTTPQDKSDMELLEFEDKPSSQTLNFPTQPQHSAPTPTIPPPPSHLKNKEEEKEESLYYDDVHNSGQGNNNNHFSTIAPPLPPGPSPQPPHKPEQGKEDEEEGIYEDVSASQYLWPQNNLNTGVHHQPPPSVPPQRPLPGLPGTLPQDVPNTIPGSSNIPPRPLAPIPPSKESPYFSNILNKNRSNTNNSKSPPQLPIRRDSAKQETDFRDKLPPPPKPLDNLGDYDVCEQLPSPPKPLDDLDDYDDVQSIYTNAKKPAVPTGKPSFLHKPSDSSLKVKPTGGPIVNQVQQKSRQWPPVQTPSQASTVPSLPNFSGGEDFYVEI